MKSIDSPIDSWRAGMKTSIALCLAIVFAGCASTTVKDGSGHTRMRTQADADSLEYHDEHSSLVIKGMNHSGPTMAGGHATSRIIKASGAAASGLILAYGSGGASTAVGAVASKLGAVAVPLSSNVSGNATPAPAKAK